jgi:hypothetical protein
MRASSAVAADDIGFRPRFGKEALRGARKDPVGALAGNFAPDEGGMKSRDQGR